MMKYHFVLRFAHRPQYFYNESAVADAVNYFNERSKNAQNYKMITNWMISNGLTELELTMYSQKELMVPGRSLKIFSNYLNVTESFVRKPNRLFDVDVVHSQHVDQWEFQQAMKNRGSKMLSPLDKPVSGGEVGFYARTNQDAQNQKDRMTLYAAVGLDELERVMKHGLTVSEDGDLHLYQSTKELYDQMENGAKTMAILQIFTSFDAFVQTENFIKICHGIRSSFVHLYGIYDHISGRALL